MAAFIEFLKNADKSKKTTQGYFFDVKKVLSTISKECFNSAAFGEINLSCVTAEQVKKVEQLLFKEPKLKPRTLCRLKHGWNSFCSFVGMNEWKIISKMNTGREYKNEVISNTDVGRMLNYCQEQLQNAKTDAERIRWLRIEIAINLGWAQGFRSCEYGNAKIDEIENDDRITIRNSKHNGTRSVALTKEKKIAIIELKKLLFECNNYPDGGGVFEKPDGKNYSTSTFRRWLKKVAAACGISDNLSKTHGLRHRLAKNFHGVHRDEFMLADIMGHKSTETTRVYAEVSFENQRDSIQRASDKARVVNLRASRFG